MQNCAFTRFMVGLSFASNVGNSKRNDETPHCYIDRILHQPGFIHLLWLVGTDCIVNSDFNYLCNY